MNNENKTPRAWLYARIPGNYVATQDSLEVCRMRAEQDGCQIAGSSTDLRGTWHFRPGYRSMMQQIKPCCAESAKSARHLQKCRFQK